MKTYSSVLNLILLVIFTLTTTQVFSQTARSKKSDQTITMKVPGVCGDCKNRIESAVMDVAGVKKAEWDVQSEMLVVVGSSKMKKEKIGAALAKAGYRSDVCAADPDAYAKLPACCQYDSGQEKH